MRLTLVGAILFTYLSTFFYQEELAITKIGDYTKEEAAYYGYETEIYKGWPNVIYWGGFGIPSDVRSLLDFIGYIPAYILYFAVVLMSIIPDLLFWGFVSFILIILFYGVQKTLGILKKKWV